MYEVIEYELYKKKRKYVEKLGQLSRLDKTIYNIRQENYGGSFSDHPLQKTSKAKSGLDKLRECHVTGEILLIYRKINNKIELVDICKNHKDLDKLY